MTQNITSRQIRDEQKQLWAPEPRQHHHDGRGEIRVATRPAGRPGNPAAVEHARDYDYLDADPRQPNYRRLRRAAWSLLSFLNELIDADLDAVDDSAVLELRNELRNALCGEVSA